MKKIYIAGCGGMLGEAFYNKFGESYELKCSDIDVNDSWLSTVTLEIWMPTEKM